MSSSGFKAVAMRLRDEEGLPRSLRRPNLSAGSVILRRLKPNGTRHERRRLRRIERLERRKPTGKPWTDPYPLMMRLWVDLQAVVAGGACLAAEAAAVARRRAIVGADVAG